MHQPMTPDERQQIKGKLAPGGGGIPLVEGYDVVMRLLATIDALEAAGKRLDAALGKARSDCPVTCLEFEEARAAWRQARCGVKNG